VSFVAKNRDVLVRYWNGAVSTSEMLDLVERALAAKTGKQRPS
jgi:hypothetical protein